MTKGAQIGILAFALFLISHWLLFGVWRLRSRSRVLFGLTLVFGVLMLLALAQIQIASGSLKVNFPLAQSVASVISFGCLWFLYMPFYYTIQDSLSIGMLIDIVRSGVRGVPVSDLKPETRPTIQRRLDRMVIAGYISATDDGYRLTRKGRIVARLFRAIKDLWKLGPGG
ncbi:MAG: hypothetical protein WAO95_01140 [Burkholderiales bacterium]